MFLNLNLTELLIRYIYWFFNIFPCLYVHCHWDFWQVFEFDIVADIEQDVKHYVPNESQQNSPVFCVTDSMTQEIFHDCSLSNAWSTVQLKGIQRIHLLSSSLFSKIKRGKKTWKYNIFFRIYWSWRQICIAYPTTRVRREICRHCWDISASGACEKCQVRFKASTTLCFFKIFFLLKFFRAKNIFYK